MDNQQKRKRVLCPVAGKDGKTYWLRMGSGFINNDSSINVYLDCLPVNGKLQIRDWDEPRERRADDEARPLSLPLGERSPGGTDNSTPF